MFFDYDANAFKITSKFCKPWIAEFLALILTWCNIFFPESLISRIVCCPSPPPILMTHVTLSLKSANEADDYISARFASVITVILLFFCLPLCFLCLCMLHYFLSVRETWLSQSFPYQLTGLQVKATHAVQSTEPLPIYLGTVLPCLRGQGMEMRFRNATRFRRRPWGLIRASRWKTHYWTESPSHCAARRNGFMEENIK